MKKTICFIALISSAIFFCQHVFAQGWTDPRDQILNTKREFSDEIINQLKATKTVFFYTGATKAQLDSFKHAAVEGWDLTEMIFDDYANIDKYADMKYSFIDVESVVGDHATWYFLTLRLITDVTKKGKLKTIGMCRIELFPDSKSIQKFHHGYKPKTIEEIYEDGIFYNLSPVLLKAQLQSLSTNLKNKVRPNISKEIKADNLTQLLSNDTLYVPVSILVDYNPFSWEDKSKKDNVFENYHYKYRFCSNAELYNIFETEHRGRLLFEYVKSCADKFITIYDLKEKTIIYKQHAIMSFNLKDKDIERIE